MRFSSGVDRVFAGWFVGVLTAVLVALGALALINRTVYEPAGQVRQYFQALRAGDGERALGILGAEVPDSNAAMLSGEAVSNSLKTLKDLTVKNTEIQGDHATVTVAYTLDETPQTTDFHLTKVGSHWGVFDQWHIDSTELPTVHVSSSSVDAATLNNEKVAVDNGNRDFAVFYPGEFTVAYESSLFSSQEQTVAVTSPTSTPQDLTVALKPSESAINSVRYQVQSQLDKCATQNTLYPAGCPFEYPFDGRVQGDVSWKITDYPEPSPTVDQTGRWVLDDSRGTAEVSFTELDLYTGKTSQVKHEVPFTYSANLQVTDTEVTVE